MIISIPLRIANLCSNCDEISIMSKGSECPVCQSRALTPLASFLNRNISPLPKTPVELHDFLRIPSCETIRELLKAVE